MLDIIFISYDEPDADLNFQHLKDRFPHARRVHGIKGIANAHIAAAKKAMTKFFYVVDGDAKVRDDFDFSFKPQVGEEQYVHIWNAHNPIGLTYGYGGVKLFNKEFFKDVKNQLDFSTTLTKDVKYHEQISCDTLFNSDYLRAFRGAFREGAKLMHLCEKIAKQERTEESQRIGNEAAVRLGKWCNPPKCAFQKFIKDGARAGMDYALKRPDDLSFINEHSIIVEELKQRYPEHDISSKPIAPTEMKHEFFFTTRIASALYDPSVLSSLPVTELRDAISDGQLLSKSWLIEQLRPHLKTGAKVAILGGWIGTLALMMHAFELPVEVTSIDLDPRANRIAEKLNWDFTFKTQTLDMYDVDYEKFDVIINTSSEHIPDIAKWRAGIPEGKIVVVQNNNFIAGDGHVSCVRNSDELRMLMNLSEIIYEGTRTLPAYNRFMLIGRT
jgi:hypothetical protein